MIDTKLPTIAYIPGFNSTSVAFTYLRHALPEHAQLPINYVTHQPLADSIQEISKSLPKQKPIYIVAHSLGGVIACHVAALKKHNIKGMIIISSPLGGSRAAWFMRWVMRSPVLNDITPDSVHIKKINDLLLPPVDSIISTSGSMNTSFEKNDSVVTVSSQSHLLASRQHFIEANHFEVLQHPSTKSVIENHIWGI